MAYLKRLTRFNYWNYGAINPLFLQDINRQKADKDGKCPPLLFTADTLEAANAAIAHRNLSAEYQRDHDAGDLQAIFEYAKADVGAFRAPWVVTQIEAWRLENTAASRKKLQKLFRAYTDDRGSRKMETLKTLIKRDQAMFKDIITLHEQGMPLRASQDSDGRFWTIAQRYGVKEGTVEEMYREYKAMADRMMGKLLEPEIKAIECLRKKGSIPPDQEPIPPPALLSTWDEVFTWLAEMAARL